jgi:hypothetical protein
MQANCINTSFFSKDSGVLLLATSKIFRWNVLEDKKSRISIEQQHTVAQDFLL